MNLKPLNEQVVVITGGSSGIGLATALMAAREGATVVIVARGEDGLKSAADRIRSAGGKCDYLCADVGSRDQVRGVVEAVLERHGRFDTWVSNAGVAVYTKLEDLSDEDHRRVFETNYWGVVHCATEALPHLKRHGGALITTGSISSQMPAPVLSSYTASKYAVKGYIDSLRLELMHENAPVSVTLIQPSGINTPFGEHALNQMEGRAMVPPPVYSPDLVAEAICRAAQHPTRDKIVGGAGRSMTLLANLAPGLADRVFSSAFFKLALDKDNPKRARDGGFHRSGGEGDIYGEQSEWMRETSVYSKLRRHPALSAVALLGLGTGLLGWLQKRRS
ncbi:SDR family oxidoreductase [Qipengyuania sp. DY56-A-20]|jgi:NAD(P)-dependent dehydrogenase (short-subunit alcohol dehydrogenase family)|uniref:SDR family oxidoreductase n=1 Tax=Qipengyuania benthica TaxID=3067651 RepID=A0ABT9H8E3_9SPHN|nr:SDR family oxidoreductase [Qipengyuania sp. DY56-A-20]MDP4539304.1 SDR family oxidoreductase [Qipengyuania sp. DY56-A-20]